MLRRLLNIASIVCLVACVALMGLWVRSYWWVDEINVNPTAHISLVLTSRPGRLLVTFDDDFNLADRGPFGSSAAVTPPLWSLHSDKYSSTFQPEQRESRGPYRAIMLFRQKQFLPSAVRPVSGPFVAAAISYWLLVLTSGTLAMLFQLRWPPRFTLRSLFIATTFLAIVLGMIAWLDRAWIGK
jgi:hypothetical protein